MNRPITLMIKPASSMCNLKCDYCFYLDEEKNREDKHRKIMTNDTIEIIVKKTHKESNIINYIFQGGEPALATLNWFENFINLVNTYKKDGDNISYSFQTNGTLIDEPFAKFLSENNFLVGVSFDGFSRIHDIHRKYSTKEKSSRDVINGINNLRKYNADYNVLTVVTNEVALNINKIYSSLVNGGEQYLQFIACLDPFYEDSNKFLNPNTYGKFLVELFDLWYADLRHGKNISIRLFNNFIAILLGNPPEACDMNGICSIQYVFESNGDVFPCDFYCLDDYLLGNILVDNYDDLDKKREEINFVKNPPLLLDDCISCEYLYLCRGGCPRYKDSNNKFKFCESYKYLFKNRLDQFKEIARIVSNK
ncbi:MAG: radical SAM protein [Pleomorphochaeta sp.]